MGNNIKKLSSSNEIKKHYDIKEILGTGSFAVVKRAVAKKSGQEFAIKIIKKTKLSADELNSVHDEVEIMHKIHHPHCIELIEMFESKQKIYMVMELLTGGELFDRIVSKGSYSEREASQVVKSIASALNYLHGIGVAHRDLKPENLLYQSPDFNSPIKLTDFGLAKYRAHSEKELGMKTACGTPGYVSPEIVNNVRYTVKTDVWSLGVITYILLCGFPPFYSESTFELYQQIKHGDYSFPNPYWSEISKEAKDLIRHMLCVDANKRFSAAQVLAHDWISSGQQSTKSLGNKHTKLLMIMQARRRLRRCVQIVRACNRLADIGAKNHQQINKVEEIAPVGVADVNVSEIIPPTIHFASGAAEQLIPVT